MDAMLFASLISFAALCIAWMIAPAGETAKREEARTVHAGAKAA